MNMSYFLQHHFIFGLSVMMVVSSVVSLVINILIYKIPQQIHLDFREQNHRYLNKQCLVIIVMLNLALTLLIVCYFHFSWAMAANLVLMWGLLLLAGIDMYYYLLPDCLTLSLLWLGLFCNSFALFVPLTSAVWGAMLGYISLWCVAALFKYCRGIDGLGQGDMKLLALFGAWWGMLPLLYIVLMAAILGIIGGILCLRRTACLTQPIPFGPFLAVAGIFMMFFHRVL